MSLRPSLLQPERWGLRGGMPENPHFASCLLSDSLGQVPWYGSGRYHRPAPESQSTLFNSYFPQANPQPNCYFAAILPLRQASCTYRLVSPEPF